MERQCSAFGNFERDVTYSPLKHRRGLLRANKVQSHNVELFMQFHNVPFLSHRGPDYKSIDTVDPYSFLEARQRRITSTIEPMTTFLKTTAMVWPRVKEGMGGYDTNIINMQVQGMRRKGRPKERWQITSDRT